MTRVRDTLLIVACLLAVVGLTACGSSGSRPTAKKSSPICMVTEAGGQLCGEQADVYCREYGGPGTDRSPCLNLDIAIEKAVANGDTEASEQWQQAKAATPVP